MTTNSRNLRTFPIFQLSFWAAFDAPIFLLFYLSLVSLSEAVLLGAIYYFVVVLFEVPSGYFSDRFGRKITLCLSSFFLFLANAVYLFAEDFYWLALGRVLWGLGYSFFSGTDVSFHLDSCEEEGLASEFFDREAKIKQWGMITAGIAALMGGLMATWSLRLPYFACSLACLVSLGVALRFTEPKRYIDTPPFLPQIKDCFKDLLDSPNLLWFFSFSVVMVSLEHIPYEFYQRYLDLLGSSIDWWKTSQTPFYCGVLLAIMSFFSSYFAGKSAVWYRIWTPKVFLLSAALLELTIVALMSVFFGLWVIIPILFYKVPIALYRAPLYAAMAAKIPTARRATFLSIQSLAGRLCFSLLLYLLASVAPKNESHLIQLQSFSGYAGLACGAILFLLLLVRVKKV